VTLYCAFKGFVHKRLDILDGALPIIRLTDWLPLRQGDESLVLALPSFVPSFFSLIHSDRFHRQIASLFLDPFQTYRSTSLEQDGFAFVKREDRFSN
jgi:hypothetical protein